MSNYTRQFDAATQSVTQERGKHYGHPRDLFNNIVALQSGVSACPNPRIRHALDMICVKMARLCRTPDHLDSIIDIAGYARTMAMILDKEQADG
jgi:hypothetical protein